MRRSKKTPNSSTADANSSRSSTGRAPPKEVDKVDQLFYSYADKGSGMIDPEGVESFCSDMGVSHTDVRILMLAWKMQAEKQGYFTLEEWRRGLKALHADSISKIQKSLPYLEKELTRPVTFSDFHTYSFRYCLTEDMQKNIDIESACELLNLVLRSRFPSQVDKIVEFLESQHEYKVMNLDQWTCILRFCNEINFPSLDNYDLELAWPLLLDSFVEWMRS